jgi:hypothetical protein
VKNNVLEAVCTLLGIWQIVIKCSCFVFINEWPKQSLSQCPYVKFQWNEVTFPWCLNWDHSQLCIGIKRKSGVLMKLLRTLFFRNTLFLLSFFFFSGGLWFDLRAHTSKAGILLLEPHLQPILFWLFLEMESKELFAWIGLELWSSWSLPPK